jgi:hypothetical protein
MPPKVATRSSLEQVAILDAMIARPRGAALWGMAEAIGSHEKTVRRHIAWIERMFGLETWSMGHGAYKRWQYRDGLESIFTREARQRIWRKS